MLISRTRLVLNANFLWKKLNARIKKFWYGRLMFKDTALIPIQFFWTLKRKGIFLSRWSFFHSFSYIFFEFFSNFNSEYGCTHTGEFLNLSELKKQ